MDDDGRDRLTVTRTHRARDDSQDNLSVGSSTATSGIGSISVDSKEISIVKMDKEYGPRSSARTRSRSVEPHILTAEEHVEETLEGILMHPPRSTAFTPPDGGIKEDYTHLSHH